MAHQISFINDINSFLKMDDPISKGPPPRWQKSGVDNSNASVNVSLNTSRSKKLSTSMNNSTMSKTPNGRSSYEKKKTPAKTPKKTPSKSPGLLGNNQMADRFIPNRSTTNFELGDFLMTKPFQDEDNDEGTPNKDNQRILSETLMGCDVNKLKVLSYQCKPLAPPEGHINHLKVVYSQSKSAVKSNTRYISQTPDRILDAPDIVDDYYLNLIDWGSNNILAVALANCVFLWNAGTGAIEELVELEGNDLVCSVAWIQDGNHLAVGTSSGTIQLWDCAQMKRLRSMGGHTSRIGSLAWNQYMLSSGDRNGTIVHHDVRQREHVAATINAHSQEVCGLRWSPDGKYLASGGNDNVLNIWPLVTGQLYTQNTPLHAFTAHQAAVKALAWCPWQPSVLASGGGTSDRCIRIWNINRGTCLSTTDTKSQVCSLQWSVHFKELISGHGYVNNQISIWKYPAMSKVADLTGHTARILHLCLSPDGTSVLSASGDETLRLWKCFVPDPTKKVEKPKTSTTSILGRGLR